MDIDPFTAALHADDALAELPDVAPALRPSTTFEFQEDGRVYQRLSHETTERLEAVLGTLAGGSAVAYPSGMAAVAAVLRHLRPQRISIPDEVYHGVADFVDREADRGTWAVVAPDQLGPGDVWWVETPSNPRCLITDLAAVAAKASDRGVVTVADATFATPVLQDTLGLGIDFSVHATTKYIAGHSDAMGGVAVTRDVAAAEQLLRNRTIDGAIPGSLESWLTLRGVRTLPLRVDRQSDTALEVATYLSDRGATVWYPGLETHPDHDVARHQMRKFGGMLAIDVYYAETAARIVADLEFFMNATSLGGVESLAEHRLRSDPSAPPGLIRLSIGLENPQTLIDDLERALSAQ